MLTGRLTCTQLLSAYVQVSQLFEANLRRLAVYSSVSLKQSHVALQRINRYDPTGTNAVRALSVTLVADGLAKDAQLQQVRVILIAVSPAQNQKLMSTRCASQVIASNGTLDPLFCVPLVVKDNIDLVSLSLNLYCRHSSLLFA